MHLRQRFGPSARIVLSKADLKNAYRQVSIDPAQAANFGHVFHDLAVGDLRLEFGVFNSPGFRGLVAASIENSHKELTVSLSDFFFDELRRTLAG